MFSESITTSIVDDEPCRCARCGDQMRRLARKGFVQSKLLPLFGFYPWECFACRSKQLVRSRGTSTFHRIWDDTWIELEAEPAEIAPADLSPLSVASMSEADSSPEIEHSLAVPQADA